MRHSKRFSQRYGSLMVMILCVLLAIVIMPACSKKKAGEEASPAGKAAVSEKTPDAGTAVSQEQRRELAKKLQQLQGELILKQGVVLNRHPELSKEQEALRQFINEKMAAILQPHSVELGQIPDLQKKLQDQSLPEDAKTALKAELQEKNKLVQQARTEAMNDPQVKEKYQQYADHLKELMITEYPETKEQMESFEKVQADLRKIDRLL